ncbi:MAG: M23 family metallopeptidase [Kiritimatiellia bacterium]
MDQEAELGMIEIELPDPVPDWPLFTHPTPQRKWREVENPLVFMATGSGRILSAFFGSTRTNSSGRAVFHEGVDIAPLQWDRRGRALDEIFAVADGTVGYINRIAGNSSYGIYVVVDHPDELGAVYTLYSHLASVPSDLKTGQSVERGQVIGQMGHTSTLGIPPQRSHLHLETGLMVNPAFSRWYREQKMTPNHGNYHGFNLTGFDPMILLRKLAGVEEMPFSFKSALEEIPAAWQLILRSRNRPNFFGRYPPLWKEDTYTSPAMVLDLSENGIILQGRNATDAELEELDSARNKVLSVDTTALGRNGAGLIERNRSTWRLTRRGEQWLEILMYDAGSN